VGKRSEIANVVVALREKRTGRLWIGEPGEQHADLRRRCDLGERTAGWLLDGFLDLDAGEFLTRGQAWRRWPAEAGRTRGRGTADSSDFAAIRRARGGRKAARGPAASDAGLAASDAGPAGDYTR
jgi:hypothetical protein